MGFVGRFFLLVLVLGYAELYLLVEAAGSIGFLATLALCFLTGVVGGGLVRRQGLQTLQEIQAALPRGEVPAVEIASGVVLLLVGMSLITPGFITDAAGFAMLVPPIRIRVARVLVRYFKARAGAGQIQFVGPGSSAGTKGRPAGRGRVIDIDPEPPKGAGA